MNKSIFRKPAQATVLRGTAQSDTSVEKTLDSGVKRSQMKAEEQDSRPQHAESKGNRRQPARELGDRLTINIIS